MSSRVSSHHLVMRRVSGASGVTGDGAGDALDMLEHALDAPEAAAGEDSDLMHCLIVPIDPRRARTGLSQHCLSCCAMPILAVTFRYAARTDKLGHASLCRMPSPAFQASPALRADRAPDRDPPQTRDPASLPTATNAAAVAPSPLNSCNGALIVPGGAARQAGRSGSTKIHAQ